MVVPSFLKTRPTDRHVGRNGRSRARVKTKKKTKKKKKRGFIQEGRRWPFLPFFLRKPASRAPLVVITS